MRYLLLIYTVQRPEADWSDEEVEAEMQAYDRFVQDAQQRGVLQGGEALQNADTATTVRVRDGDVLTTDGPFAETKELLGGYFLVDCKDLDEAVEIAARIPSATHGSIEVRPIMEISQSRP